MKHSHTYNHPYYYDKNDPENKDFDRPPGYNTETDSLCYVCNSSDNSFTSNNSGVVNDQKQSFYDMRQ